MPPEKFGGILLFIESTGHKMYLLVKFNNKTYNLGACLDKAHLEAIVHAYAPHFPGLAYTTSDGKVGLSQFDFIRDYKAVNFMTAQLETYDVDARFMDAKD